MDDSYLHERFSNVLKDDLWLLFGIHIEDILGDEGDDIREPKEAELVDVLNKWIALHS